MNVRLPLPFWLVRKIAKRNPWLLAEQGKIARGQSLKVGPFELEVDSSFQLKPENRERLVRERDQRGPAT